MTTNVLTGTTYGNPFPLVPKFILPVAMAIRVSSSSSLLSHNLGSFRHQSNASPLLPLSALKATPLNARRKRFFGLTCRSSSDGDEDYLLDAPVSVGDGFSFSGGKYSDGPNPADEWFKRGKIVKAYPVFGSGKKAKDPFFGLTMGGGSQASDDVFRVHRLKHALYI